MNDISIIHEEVYQYLIAKNRINPEFVFVPRKINNKDRFEKGYWFIGDDYYMQLTFWDGSDTLRRIHNIGFSVKYNGESIIDLSGKNQPHLTSFFEEVMKSIKGFKEWGGKSIRRWYKENNTKNFLKELDFFIDNYKDIIDELVRQVQPKGIGFLQTSKFKSYINTIESYRDKPETKEKTKTINLELRDKFALEFDGTKIYTPSEMKVVIAKHGKIINKLIDILQNKKISIKNDNHRDLYILNENNEIAVLFELKTDLSTSSIYSAIGQLLVYSADIKPRPRLVMILPRKLAENLENILFNLGLDILYYDYDLDKEVLVLYEFDKYI